MLNDANSMSFPLQKPPRFRSVLMRNQILFLPNPKALMLWAGTDKLQITMCTTDGRRRCMRIAEWRRTMLMTTTLSCFVVVELCGWGPLHSSPQCRSGDVRWWLRPERWPCHLHSHPNCAITSQPLKGEKQGCTASSEPWWSCLPALAEQSSSSIPNLKEKKGKGFPSGWWRYLYKYPRSQGQSWITCDASNVSSSYGSVDFVFGCPFWHCFMYGPKHPCEAGQVRGEMVHCYETHLGWACQRKKLHQIHTHTKEKASSNQQTKPIKRKSIVVHRFFKGCFDYLMVCMGCVASLHPHSFQLLPIIINDHSIMFHSKQW